MNGDSTFLAAQILQIIPRVMRTLAADLRSTGIMLTPAQFGVLVMLHFRPSNLSELAAYQNVSLPTMSNTVSSLVEKEWVSRRRSLIDRRVVMIELTQAGLRKLDEINVQAISSLTPLLERVSDEDRHTLSEGLGILRRLFDLEGIENSLTSEVEGPFCLDNTADSTN